MSLTGSDGAAHPADEESLPLVRVRVIRHSLGCFLLGCLGVIPWLGFPFACWACVQSKRARRGERVTWNPAGLYRVAGMGLAGIGIIVNLVSFALAAVGLILQ